MQIRPYRLNVKLLLLFAGIIIIVVLCGILIIDDDIKFDKIKEILIHYGYILLPITFFWALLENYMWHWKPVQKIRAHLNIPPDFRGRWVGKLHRTGEDHNHDFVIEIKQTASKIWIYTYSAQNSSHSQIAEIATDHSQHIFTVCYFWQGTGGEIPHLNINSGTFDGYSLLQLFENESPKRLSGKYFTNRQPQTKGLLELEWVSSYLQKKY